MKRTGGWLIVSAVAMFSSLGTERVEAQRPRNEQAEPKAHGAIVGIVRYEGAVPKQEPINVTTKEAPCHREPVPNESLVISNDKQVKWAVVSIKTIKAGKPFPPENPDEPIHLVQRGCRFLPHVVVVPRGRTLRILNDDGIFHNVHARARRNRAFNRALPPKVKQMDVTFKRPERIRVRCDVHAWMGAWIVVAEHPYVTVTERDGAFRFEGVPPGRYTIDLWHETLGKQQKDVTVTAGSEAKMDFVFKKP